MLKNVGKPTAHDMPKLSDTLKDKTKQGLNLGKVKVKSKQKINLPEQFKKSSTIHHVDEDAIANPDLRKQERINRYKTASIEVNTNALMTSDEYEKERAKKELREINNFRDTKKVSLLKTVLHQQFNDEKVYNVSFGKVEIIPIEVTNYYEYDSAFNINIDDPDDAVLAKSEFSVISNPSEWKYWVEKRGFSQPPEWQMISVNSKNLVLKAGEKVEVLIKFLTFRSYNEDFISDTRNGKAADNDPRRKKHIAPRTVHLSISHSNGRIMNGIKLQIVPHSVIVDHTFRFFEQANKSVTLYMPSLYHFTLPPTHKPILCTDYSKAVVEWLNDKEIALQLTIPGEMELLKFNLLVYNDVYYAELLGNWAIEILPCYG